VTARSAQAALELGRDALLRGQDGEGWWKGVLDTNVTMDAEDLLLRHVLGVLDPADVAATGAWIRSQQRDDGTWATFHGGPADLSTTVEGYVALRLAGDAADASHLEKARAFILEHGGVERTRVFTRIWLAICGRWSWDDLPALPPEIMLLPSSMPLNIYDFACWARRSPLCGRSASRDRCRSTSTSSARVPSRRLRRPRCAHGRAA
jgi:squalene-hopene/tetraprenyl-beta-curcumene cyclase